MSEWDTEDRTKQSANASSLLRDKITDINEKKLKALNETGLISNKALNHILSMKNGLKHSNKDYKKTKEFKEIIEKEMTEKLDKAVKNDNLSVKSYAVGRIKEDKSIGQYHRLKEVKNHITTVGHSYIFGGDTNKGKTSLALLFAEMFVDSTNGKILTNMTSISNLKNVVVKENYFELKKELKESNKTCLIIIEDASNHLSGYTVDKDFIEKEYRIFMNQLAKNNGIIFHLGHTGKAIHPHIRRMSYFVKKHSLKSATIYDGVKNGKGTYELINLSNVPDTKVKYDDSEKTVFITSKQNKKEDKQPKKDNKIKKEISKRLQTQKEVKTVEIPYNNSKVAEIMREISKTDGLRFIESKSPKRLVKKQL